MAGATAWLAIRKRCVFSEIVGFGAAGLGPLKDKEIEMIAEYSGLRGGNQDYVLDKMICRLDDIWPNSQVFFSSGVQLDLYYNWLIELLGPIDFRELYACTECMSLGFQLDSERGMWPNLDLIFFEFIPMKDYRKDVKTARRLAINEVQVGSDYVIALTTIGGLYSYILGDVVRFTSLAPLRLAITGRTHKEISLSGEKVTENHIISALRYASRETGAVISDFTATGRIDRAPRHEVGIEFAIPPTSLDKFASFLDLALCKENNAYSEIRQIGSIDPVLVETNVTTYPYPVTVDYTTNRVTKAGNSTVNISKE